MQSLNGSYLNSAKQKLVFSNHDEGISFDFTIKWGINDHWGCLSEAARVAYLKGKQTYNWEEKALTNHLYSNIPTPLKNHGIRYH